MMVHTQGPKGARGRATHDEQRLHRIAQPSRNSAIQHFSAAGCGSRRAALRHRRRDHRRRTSLPRGHFSADECATFRRGCGGAAGQRVLHIVFRPSGRLDGTQDAHDRERLRLCDEHPGDRALARLRTIVLWPAAAGHERRTDRGGRAAVPGRVPGGIEPRQRDGDLSMDADAGDCGRRTDRHLLQLSRGSGWEVGRRRSLIPIQGSCVAQHLLGFAASGRLVRTGQPVCHGVSAMAVSARRKGSRLCGAAAVAKPRSGHAGT